MRIKLLIGTALAVAGLLSGCGGGGGGDKSGSQSGSIRTLMGYVYVKDASNVNASDPDVIITPASTPPAEPHKYNIPTGGKITLIAENGTFLQKVSSGYTGSVFTKDLSDGNDIIVNVQLEPGGKVNVAGNNVTYGSDTKYLEPFETTVNDGKPSGTTALLRSPKDPETRTPNPSAIAEVKFTLDGVAPEDPNELIAGDRKFLGIGYIDADGLAVPGVPSIGNGVTITSSDPNKVQVNNTDNILTTAVKGQTAGPVTIQVSVNSPSPASGSLTLNYGFGEPANVAVYRKVNDKLTRLDIASLSPVVMRWDIATNPRSSNMPSYILLVAEVTNKYGAAIPDLQIDWSNVKAPGNTWATSAGGYAFVDPNDEETPAPTTTTDINGQTVVRFQVPAPIDGPLSGRPGDGNNDEGDGDQSVKALNFIYANVHGTSTRNTIPAKTYITRQYAELVIAESTVGKKSLVNAYTKVPYTTYARDVDGWESQDAYVAKWTVRNKTGGEKVGDPGEREFAVTPTPTAYMEGNNLVTSSIPGIVFIKAYVGDMNDPEAESAEYQVRIMGPPAYIALSLPDDGQRTNVWEEFKVPEEATPLTTKPYSQDPIGNFTPDTGTPPKYWCYHYLGVYDAGGRITAVAPGQYTLTTTNYNCTVTTPSTPTGAGGSQPVIVQAGAAPFPARGDFTVRLVGTWQGYMVGGDDIPMPTVPVPFSLFRQVRVGQ